MPKHSETRKLYDRCYRARRGHDIQILSDVWDNHRAVYRAAAESHMSNAGTFSGWIKPAHRWAFLCRLMDLQNAR